MPREVSCAIQLTAWLRFNGQPEPVRVREGDRMVYHFADTPELEELISEWEMRASSSSVATFAALVCSELRARLEAFCVMPSYAERAFVEAENPTGSTPHA